MKRKAYGIIAIIHMPGVVQEVFDLFKKRYPEADVFVVEQTQAEWRMLETKLPAEDLAKVKANFEARCEATRT